MDRHLKKKNSSKCWGMYVRKQDLQTQCLNYLSDRIKGIEITARMGMHCGWSEISVHRGSDMFSYMLYER